MLVDSHAHLTDEDYKDDLAAVAERWRRAGVGLVVTVGTDLEDSRRAVELAAGLADVRATVGLHPNEARKWHDGSFEQFKTLARHPRVVAIGETGLDHHYAPTPGDREFQAVVFREHIRLARETGLPLMIHTRDAHEETLKILKEERGRGTPDPPMDPPHSGRPVGLWGVIHCYTGDWQTAQRYLEMGFLISFGGIVTFGKSAAALEETARQIPAGGLVLETDCPWLAPAPHRGGRNEPAYVALVAERVAALKGVPRSEIEAASTANAKRIFRLGEEA